MNALVRPDALVPGTNHLAVEIHQCSRISSDLSFDLTLTAPQSILVSTMTLLGAGEGQIPEGSIITHAALTVPRTEGESETSLIRLSEPTRLGDTFAVEQRTDESTTDSATFLVQSTVQAWCDGDDNHGWALLRPGEAGSGSKKWSDIELAVHFLPPQEVAQVAWLLATCTDADARDPATALNLAQRAVKYAGSDAESWAAMVLHFTEPSDGKRRCPPWERRRNCPMSLREHS